MVCFCYGYGNEFWLAINLTSLDRKGLFIYPEKEIFLTFKFYKIMKELNLNQLENLEGGKFWGKETVCTTAGCATTCYTNTYRFWIRSTKLESLTINC